MARADGRARLACAEISSGCIWPSFSTGTNPLKNGQFFTHMQLRGGSYKIDKKYASHVSPDPFWVPLADSGRRVFTFDIAQTRPIDTFNGVNLCGWGSEYPAWPRSSWPKPLMGEQVAKYGSHPLVNEYRLSISPETEEEYRELYDKLTVGMERKGRICLDVLSRERWNLALIVFPEPHWAMHLLWQTYDSEHPAYNPDVRPPFDNIFLDLYRKLDIWIARFIELMPDATVLVFSGSGSGPNYSGWHLLPEVLDRIGMGPSIKTGSLSTAFAVLPIRRWGASKIRKVEDTLSLPVIEFLKKTVPAPVWDTITRRLLYAGSRWAESKAFALPNDYSGAIRINLKGREPHGIVSPGTEYAAVRDAITYELKRLTNCDTGKPIVADVIRLKELYPHEELGDFPDLLVIWSNDAPITSVTSPTVGVISREFPERRSGAHRNDCFLISTQRLAAREPGATVANILDLAPTVFELLSVEPPRYFDGRALLT